MDLKCTCDGTINNIIEVVKINCRMRIFGLFVAIWYLL